MRSSGEGNVREGAMGQLTNQLAQVWGEVNFAVKQITKDWKKNVRESTKNGMCDSC